MGPNLYQIDPMRTPRWRADLAIRIVQDGPGSVHPGALEDEYVKAYVKLLTKLTAAEAARSDSQHVRRSMPHLYDAHSFYFSRDEYSRAILESWLLTRESFQQIAKRCGLDEEFVRYYEALYFNIADRLQCFDWVVKTIHDSNAGSAIDPNGAISIEEIGVFLRLCGYFGGPLGLAHAIGAVVPEKGDGSKSQISAQADEDLLQTMAIRAASSWRRVPLNGKNALRLIRLSLKAQAVKAKAKTATHREH